MAAKVIVLSLEKLFSVIWREEVVPRQWREGLIVNLFKKGDREQPGNFGGITRKLMILYGEMGYG